MILAALICVLHPVASLRQDPEINFASPLPAIVKHALATQPHWKFIGTREVTIRHGAEFSQHTEYVTRDGWNQRIDFPSDSRFGGQVIVETETDRRRFDPKKDEIHVSPPRHEPLFDHVHGRRSYHLLEAPGEWVAGLPTRLVTVVDADGNRVQELNIEPKSGVVLARKSFDDVGTQRASFKFERIDLRPHIDPSVFRLHRRHTPIFTPEDDLVAAVSNSEFLPMMIPADTGHLLDSARIRKIAGQDTLKSLVSQYIGPKGWLVLFQLAVGVDPATLDRQAPKHVHTATAEIRGRWFVAVGPQPESELAEALNHLRPAIARTVRRGRD